MKKAEFSLRNVFLLLEIDEKVDFIVIIGKINDNNLGKWPLGTYLNLCPLWNDSPVKRHYSSLMQPNQKWCRNGAIRRIENGWDWYLFILAKGNHLNRWSFIWLKGFIWFKGVQKCLTPRWIANVQGHRIWYLVYL